MKKIVIAFGFLKDEYEVASLEKVIYFPRRKE